MLNVGQLNDGFVLDHIEAGKAMMIYNNLGLDKLDCQVAIIKNARSNKMGKKDIIKIEGSVELAPLLGLVDGIVDLVETGNTLRENGLVEVEDVMQVSARLIVNVASMKLKKNEINALIDKIEALKEEVK